MKSLRVSEDSHLHRTWRSVKQARKARMVIPNNKSKNKTTSTTTTKTTTTMTPKKNTTTPPKITPTTTSKKTTTTPPKTTPTTNSTPSYNIPANNMTKPYFWDYYYTQIGVGTPPQYFDCLVDTGSWGFWVQSINCTDCDNKGNKFQRNLSSTYVLGGQETGQWDFVNNGVYGYDTLTIGSLKLKNYNFVEVTDGSGSISCMIGLAPESPDYEDSNSGSHMVHELYKQGLIKRYSFSIFLDRPVDDAPDVKSMLFLGGSNSNYYVGPMTYINWIPNQYARFNLSTVSFGSYNFKTNSITNMDTGGWRIYAPNSIVNTYNSLVGKITPLKLPNDPIYFPCTILPKLPNITFTFVDSTNKFSAVLTGLDIVYEYTDGKTQMCESGFNYGGDSNEHMILDQFFLRTTYVEFDIANNRYGLAKRNPNIF